MSFKDVPECGITMMAAHRSINYKMQSEKLPSIDYRISADYGEMQLAKSSSTQSQDLFGTAINVCTKINSKAPANKMVIGDDLYHIVRYPDDYNFTPTMLNGGANHFKGFPELPIEKVAFAENGKMVARPGNDTLYILMIGIIASP